MQQTEKYQLNLIETSDTFSPAALNENAQKTEAALSAETTARQNETAALAAADTALDSRVTVLEATRLVFGTYQGTHGQKTIELGFTPRFLLIIDRYRTNRYIAIRLTGTTFTSSSFSSLRIVENGFYVNEELNDQTPLEAYFYMAIT